MSGWLVVAVDGTLTHHTTTPTSALIKEAIGDWWDMVHLPSGLMGWVDGDGHPKGLERNVAGSILLMALGAGRMPYAGPVVVTGWHPVREISELTEDGEYYVRTVHEQIAGALAGVAGDAVFADAVRKTATDVLGAPTPAMTVIPLGGEGR
ncbi:hypothetical protein [Micromonospora robiginosa]|uniref:DUF3846 domain-containing protein n=1 Tax=Micromonospora robiginosa TaxID=2749844 RepID=A0A7L6B7X5_9ACTN|nr:hypothetical protein [Micromonospora ferruginea]QLQ37961.1 hypothetical protein H1D33_03445 [Micromonospora ferruginea]